VEAPSYEEAGPREMIYFDPARTSVGIVTCDLGTVDAGVSATVRITTAVRLSASGTIVSTTASERDAYERLMRTLADQIVTDLIASSSGWARPYTASDSAL